ncbi:CGNR zinc finger domain-containing protein [Kribbella sp. NPDC051620]|uniref:CGNR zinc finger domain-containing protein n=1 Tax=Kribbella sp. NPDC051620 TaxID=3364120 RepID=UPI00379DB58C
MSSVPATDPWLGFVLDLCNTYDLLEDPPDRLTIPLVARLAAHHELTDPGLTDADLEPVRAVRDRLYRVFAEADAQAQYGVLNEIFTRYGATPRLVPGPRLAATGGDDPVARLAVSSADALARAIADGAADRLRTCAADPCRCVYVDRTKANRRRYCCELCNDRIASAAYRNRKS